MTDSFISFLTVNIMFFGIGTLTLIIIQSLREFIKGIWKARHDTN